ncbi:MAG: NAD(P)-dependent oxidoreductase, partial [Tissierellia bacterium]|nr:NAD(P)-dependent oxidoreductase [Tissierellia bacterium]
MFTMNKKLKELLAKGQKIRVAIIGAGKMGKGLINQMSRIEGMVPALVVNRRVEKAIEALLSSGVPKSQIIETNSLKEANYYLEKG